MSPIPVSKTGTLSPPAGLSSEHSSEADLDCFPVLPPSPSPAVRSMMILPGSLGMRLARSCRSGRSLSSKLCARTRASQLRDGSSLAVYMTYKGSRCVFQKYRHPLRYALPAVTLGKREIILLQLRKRLEKWLERSREPRVGTTSYTNIPQAWMLSYNQTI